RSEEAVQHFHEALDLDSTFALAGLEFGRAAAWGGASAEDEARADRVAQVGRERLSPADRALLDARLGGWSSAPELFKVWDAAVNAYPDRAETWYGLGDVHYHWGLMAGEGAPMVRAADAFRRGWALDSAAGLAALSSPPIAEPMLHLVELASMQRDTAAVLRLTAQVLARDSTGELAQTLMWHRALVTGDSARRAFWNQIAGAGQLATMHIVLFIIWTGVGIEDLPRATAEDRRRLESHDPGFGVFAHNVGALNSGRPGDVIDGDARGGPPLHGQLRGRITQALSWDGDTAAARDAARSLSGYEAAPLLAGEGARTQLEDRCALGRWQVAHGDYQAAATVSRRLRAARVPGLTRDDSTSVAHYVEFCPALLDATRASALALPDARARIQFADSLARTFVFEVCCDEAVSDANLVLARLWEQAGDLSRALSATRRRTGAYVLAPLYMSSFLREEGRLAALSGDTAGAVHAYRHYLALRPDPEASVRPAVERVRRDLTALQARWSRVNSDTGAATTP
ncbi:MAG: hypothetical protein ABI742_11295, partial [Gemmatimonadota bacterium]